MLRTSLAVFAIAGATLLGGCGDDEKAGGGGGGDGLPATAKVPFLVDQTGLVSPYALVGLEGAKIAVDQANESGELGETKVELDVRDTASDPSRAVTEMQDVVKSDAPMAVYGLNSAEAVRLAPIAQQAEFPLVLWQSGSKGTVDVGNYVYRTTPLQATLQKHTSAYFASEGVKRVAIIYNSDIPTLLGLAKDTYPELAEADGYEIVKSTGIEAKATDVSTVASELLGAKPDAVVVLLFGSQAVSVVKDLRRSGYEGTMATQTGVGFATLEAMGDAANGIVFASDFLPVGGPPSAQKFVDTFRQRYKKAPDNYAWSGYDAARMMVEALKEADEFTREGMQTALQDVAQGGFDGAIGRVTFEERDARTDGGLLQWNNGELKRVDAN